MSRTEKTDERNCGAPRRRSVFARFAKRREGAVSIEFAFLALPFFLVVFAILESCISFAAQQVLANVTDDIAREIRTGQLKNLNEGTLKTRICNDLAIVVSSNCKDQLIVDLREFATFKLAADAAPIKFAGKTIDKAGMAVTPGGSMTRNMLRVFYSWPVITDFLRWRMSNLEGGKTLLFATNTWRNEPFDD